MQALVLVTYRQRKTHLNVFLLYMQRYFPHLRIAVIEQDDKEVWNKGLLFNAGYRELAAGYDYLILHDVDFIPDNTVDYGPCTVPTLLATECSQYNYTHLYDGYFGGVIGLDKEHYEMVNGFSNMFRGWGGEDDHFRNSFIAKGITPLKRMGNRFENFTHPRPDVRPGVGKDFNSPDYKNNWNMVHRPRDFSEGLSTAAYKVIYRGEHKECVHLKIRTNINEH